MVMANEKIRKLDDDTRKPKKKMTRIGQKVNNSAGSPQPIVNLYQEDDDADTRRGKRQHDGSADVVLEENQ